MSTETIVIEYIAQVEGLKAQLKTVEASLKSVETKAKESADTASKSFGSAGAEIKKIGLEIAGALGIAFSVGKVLEFGKESVLAFLHAEDAAKKLQFAVTKIGKEGDEAFEKLIKQAEKLAKISIFSTGEIKGSQTLLAQFGLQSKQIEKLIPQIIDLASATGKTLNEATELSIAGINGQGRALKPLGIVLEDTGDKTKNLSNLMESLGKFVGSTGIAFESTNGKLENAENKFEDFKESVGEYLVTFAGDIVDTVTDLGNAFDTAAPQITLSDKALEKITKNANQFGLAMAQAQLASVQAAGGSVEAVEKITKRISELNEKINKQSEEDAKESEENKLKSTLGLTQKGIDAAKKAEEDKLKAKKEAEEEAKKEDLENLNFKEELDSKAFDSFQKRLDDQAEAQRKHNKEQEEVAFQAIDDELERIAEADEKRKKQKEDEQAALFNLTAQAGDAIFQLQIEKNQAILDSDKATDVEKRKALLAKAKLEKEQALFSIAINTAEAIIKAIAASPETFGLPFSAFALSAGGIQAALVASKPLPKFAEGVIDLKGGVKGKDSIHSLLMPGESVMTTDETQRHKELLTSIRNDNLDKFIMDKYVNPKVSSILKETVFAQNVANSSKLNFPDEYALARIMSRNKGTRIENTSELAVAIGKEINKSNIKRTWS